MKNAHFSDEGHDYGYSKRKAMYAFFTTYLHLVDKEVKSGGDYKEDFVSILPKEDLMVFDATNKLPTGALQGDEAIMNYLNIH